MTWKIRMVTHVSESQVVGEEVLFELGQSGSANPHTRRPSLPNSNTLIVTQTGAFSEYTLPEGKNGTQSRHCTGCAVVQSPQLPTPHTAKANSPVLYTGICCLAYVYNTTSHAVYQDPPFLHSYYLQFKVLQHSRSR